jgi:hypothetical protein
LRKPPIDLLFLAGVPAAGKSYLGRQLQEAHGYLHIDAELPGELDAHGLHQIWDAGLACSNAQPFVEAVRALHRPVVLNWGFPPHCLPFVASLRSAGFAAWWIDADHAAARAAYREIGRPVELFDLQIGRIRAAWPAIQKVFSPNVIRVLDASGVRKPVDEVLRTIRGDVPRKMR